MMTELFIRTPLRLVLGALLLPGVSFCQLRYGLPVGKLANPADFGAAQLDGNRFATLDRGKFSVACIAYGGLQRHFVEVKVSNLSTVPLTLEEAFVKLADVGDSTVSVNTLTVASAIQGAAATPASRPITPPANVEPMITAMEASARIGAVAFANHLVTYAHETQSKRLEPSESHLYVFVFDRLSGKALPFAVLVRVERDSLSFAYKR